LPGPAESLNKPAPNPFLSSEIYGITHFDSSQSDQLLSALPGGIPRGSCRQARFIWRPVNIITLASTDPDFMWAWGPTASPT
jgi:hypothetical protein